MNARTRSPPNPHYNFNDEILPIGSSYCVELTRELLPRHTKETARD